MSLNHKLCAMVAWHLNFQFQVLALLKGIKELGVVHFMVDAPLWGCRLTLSSIASLHFSMLEIDLACSSIFCLVVLYKL